MKEEDVKKLFQKIHPHKFPLPLDVTFVDYALSR